MIQPPSGEIVKNFIIREIEFANPHNHSQTLRFPLSIKIWEIELRFLWRASICDLWAFINTLITGKHKSTSL